MAMLFRYRCYLLMSSLWLSAPLVAADSTEEDLFQLSLEELGNIKVSVATGTPKPLSSAPAVASIITAQEMRALGAQDVSDVLEAVPGLHVSNGGIIYAPRYFIRGIASQNNPQTLVMVNGIPRRSLYLGDRGESLPTVFSLPVALIDRIEVIRGPGSALYGADAFAGVINIITKGPEQVEGGQASLSVGSFDSQQASVQQTAQLGEAKALFSFNHRRTDGDDPVIETDRQSALDAVMGTQASHAPGAAQLGVNVSQIQTELAWQDVRLRLDWMHGDDAGTGQGSAGSLDPEGRFSNDRGNADLIWQIPDLARNWMLETRLTYAWLGNKTNNLQMFPPGANLGGGVFPDGVLSRTSVSEEQAMAQAIARYEGWQTHLLSLGAGFSWDDLYQTTQSRNYNAFYMPLPDFVDISDTSAVYQPEAQRTNSYVLIQDEWAFAQGWELTAGIRYDDFSDFGDTTNPRLALVWQAMHSVTTKLLYGEAFRAPSFYELYTRSNVLSQGNPNLKPERIKSLEWVLDWRPLEVLAWNANLYQFRIRDFIDFISDPGLPTFTAQNVGRIEGHGMETELRYQALQNLQLVANYSLQRTEDESTGEALGLAPDEEANARAIWDMDARWQLTGQLVWIGERQRQAGDPREDLEGYTTLDLILRRHWSQNVVVTLAGRNLADADVREPSQGPGPRQTQPSTPNDLPQPGRSVMVGIEVSW